MTGRLLSFLGLVTLGGVHAASSLTLPAGDFDDGMQLAGAMLLRRGMLPNIDFHSVYLPLNSWLVAGFFGVLGESVASYRVFQLLAAWTTLACVMLLHPRAAYPKLTASGGLLLALVLNLSLPQLQAASALMWLQLSIMCLLLARTARRPHYARWLRVLAGLSLAALGWTRIAFAMYLAAAWAVDGSRAVWRREPQAQNQLRLELLEFAVPACAATAGLWGLWVLQGASVASLIDQVMVTPQKALVQWSIHPFAGVSGFALFRNAWLSGVLASTFPIAWIAASAAHDARGRLAAKLLYATSAVVLGSTLLVAWQRPEFLPILQCLPLTLTIVHHVRVREQQRTESFLLVVFTFSLHYVLSRPDFAHFLALFPCLAALLLVTLSGERALLRKKLVAFTVLCAVPLLYSGANMVRSLRQHAVGLSALPAMLASDDEVLSTGCGQACDVFSDPDVRAAADYIRQRTGEDERVFSGMLRQGDFGYNDVHAYWLMRRRPATRHIMLMSGITTTEQVEAEIMLGLKEHQVRWLFLRSTDAVQPVEPSALDRYVLAHYQRVARFGHDEVWRSIEN